MIHALELRVPIFELSAPYFDRPPGSTSKLSTIKDGFEILSLIGGLIKNERPLFFFSWAAAFVGISSLSLGIPIVIEFGETGLVPRFPTAILASSLGLISLLLLFTGFILDGIANSRRELRRFYYLSNRASFTEDRKLQSVTVQQSTAS